MQILCVASQAMLLNADVDGCIKKKPFTGSGFIVSGNLSSMTLHLGEIKLLGFRPRVGELDLL